MAFPAYAKAAGWTEENGNWYYYDSYGEAITDTWKKNGDDWWCCMADPFADLLLVETVVFAAIAFGAGRFRGLHEESLAVDEDPILEIHS